jgi:hypothetical protein
LTLLLHDSPVERHWHWPLGLAVITITGAAVRWRGMFNDLWLDEILSLRLLDDVRSPVEIFSRVHVDNNHPLNSLFLFLLQPQEEEWKYRLLSWTTGAASVVVAGWLAQIQYRSLRPQEPPRQARVAGVVTAVLFANCYLMVHYSSEARGYAPAVFFVLISMTALLVGRRSDSIGARVTYWLATVLALSSHPAAQQIAVGNMVWGWMATRRDPMQITRERLAQWLKWHAIPWAALMASWFFFTRRLTIAGGAEGSISTAIADTVAFTFGVPTGLPAFMALPIVAGAMACAVRFIWRDNPAFASFYVMAVLILPIVGLAATRFTMAVPRYFILTAALCLVLAGYLLTRAWGAGRISRFACAACIVLFVIGNGVHTARLFAFGRGQYRAALQYVLDESTGASVIIASDHDFRNGLVIAHHAPTLSSGDRITYSSNARSAGPSIGWFFAHRLDGEKQTPPAELHDSANLYRWRRTFGHAALSGWDWDLYERAR